MLQGGGVGGEGGVDSEEKPSNGANVIKLLFDGFIIIVFSKKKVVLQIAHRPAWQHDELVLIAVQLKKKPVRLPPKRIVTR